MTSLAEGRCVLHGDTGRDECRMGEMHCTHCGKSLAQHYARGCEDRRRRNAGPCETGKAAGGYVKRSGLDRRAAPQEQARDAEEGR